MSKNKPKVKDYTSPELNTAKDTCTLRDTTLKLDQIISYKSSAERLISMGKISEFRYAGHLQSDKESVWMNVKDVESKDRTEWISVNLWEEQNDKGYFKNLTVPTKPTVNASTEPDDTEDMPF